MRTPAAAVLGAALLLALARPLPAGVQTGAPARPLPDAAVILRTMLAAPALLDYEGTKVISTVRGARAETVTMLEAYKRLGRLRLEFLSPESTSGRLIIDDGISTWQYEPALHLVVRGPSFVQGAAHPERAPEILRRYRVLVLGRETVIGRETILVALAPGSGGSDRRLWVDETTGVVLRTEERDARGEIVYVSFFSRISYSLNLPPGLFQFRQPAGARVLSFQVTGEPVRGVADLRALARAEVVAPPVLLGRYAFRDGRVARHGAFSAVALTYTDGVGVVTVFQTPTARMAFPDVGEPLALRAGRGRLLDLGYFRVLVWQAGSVHYAVVGNVPPAVLAAIAEAVTAGR